MVLGRPRAFDLDDAVGVALRLFIAKGYEGASTGELAAAMGINPPSLYAAFGNKEGLFRKAVELYAASVAPILAQALAEPTAYGAAERYMRGNADAATDPDKPTGCLFVQGALRCSDAAIPIRDELARHRIEAEPALRDRFERALAEGDLPAGANPARLARYLSTVAQGMALQASGGASRDQLHEIIDVALGAWPSEAPQRRDRSQSDRPDASVRR